MANINADVANAAVAVPPTKVPSNKHTGRVRWFESTVTVPPTGGPAIGEQIVWGTLPVGARIIGPLSSLNQAAGAASSTINVGDNATPARHLAVTSVASAGNTALANPANGASSFVTTDNSGTATDNCTLRSVVAGAGLLAGQVLTLRVAYVTD